jgi:four helix bundle protein
MTPEELKTRLTVWAVSVVKLCRVLRASPDARHVADQLLASATSTAANYRAACRARSRREFVARVAVAVEEADESLGWIQILEDGGLAGRSDTHPIRREAEQLVAILAASRRTAARNVAMDPARRH